MLAHTGFVPGKSGAPTFRCVVCDQPKSPAGRRRVRWRGIQCYACAACVQARSVHAARQQALPCPR